MRKIRSFKISVVLLFVLLSYQSKSINLDDKLPKEYSVVLLQESKVIKGIVFDETKSPLPGVAVMVKGTSIGVVTDVDGKFNIEVPKNKNILVFSFIGMKTKEVIIDDKDNLSIILEPDAIGLSEVVAVGYGVQKKVNVVGSVTSINGAEIESIPASDVTNAISGRLPGSVVIQQSGEPGVNNARILVRGRTTLGGNTDPLVVIDGIPGRSLYEIDPVDIAGISVLKDAAAAIYGASAANGVILVTTKRGQNGLPRLNYQFYQGIMTPTILPKVTNAADYATMLSEYQIYENDERTFTDKDIELFRSGEDPWEHPNSDWMGDLVKKWTQTGKHNITLDGGYKGMYYYISGGFKNEEAIYAQESTNYKQYNIRAKIEVPVTKWLKTSVNYAGFLTSSKYPTKSSNSIYGQATRLVPTQWSFWPNGKPGPDIEYGDNPVVTSTFETGYDEHKNYKNEFTFRVSITPESIKGLKFEAYYTYDISNYYRKRFEKPWTLYFPNWDSAERDTNGYITNMELIPTPRGISTPQLSEEYGRTPKKMGFAGITYNKTFGDHSMVLFGGYEQLTEDWNGFGAFRKYYISDVVQTLNAGSDKDKNNWGSMYIYSRKSWIGRATYNYKEKYLVEFLFRRDGSLKFPTSKRWGNFPGLLLGWRASEETFWKNHLSVINYFKLRASYGSMGMDPGSPFQFMNKYVLTTGLTLGTDKTVQTVVRQQGVANPNITWEKQTTYNLGFDSNWFGDLFHLNTEFFFNKRSDILAHRNASVPGFTGLSLPDENIAEVDNRGFEIDAGFHKVINDDLKFNISGNFSWNRNEVVFQDEPERAVPWQRRTGHPYGTWLMYNAIGIFADEADLDKYPHWDGAKPGDVIFEDVSKDGKITSDDKILVEKTDAPEIFYGIAFDVIYKNWKLSALAQGQGEYYRRNIEDDRRGEAGNYFQWQFDNRWTPTNTNTSVARAYNRDDLYWTFSRNMSTYYLDNMAYCRLKNLVITYDLPKKLLGKSGISRASLSLSGNNLLLIYSAQRNYDPEIGNPMTYPAVKTFALGAQITF